MCFLRSLTPVFLPGQRPELPYGFGPGHLAQQILVVITKGNGNVTVWSFSQFCRPTVKR